MSKNLNELEEEITDLKEQIEQKENKIRKSLNDIIDFTQKQPDPLLPNFPRNENPWTKPIKNVKQKDFDNLENKKENEEVQKNVDLNEQEK
ncbi:guanine nucleotide-binding protein subunit gamma [Anaeramoeba flamelloides]|uniref:Guanine nucleotide-binding protein subunit gamma n=1 Tax=Anaeramoeba flamelloides TaxID=1746091 RepID=A0AAV8A443_9EUKA|nr:guanine nucleotide-binding protein subunit gamma [Anaeramoeba flamelloides]KAJ6246265.1 guanine nucleotide-binding protein subunit gamma [Anaeramoeba flamelloides]